MNNIVLPWIFQIKRQFKFNIEGNINHIANKCLRLYKSRRADILLSNQIIPVNTIMQCIIVIIAAVWDIQNITLHQAQIRAALLLHNGYFIQMPTGTGKTLAAIVAAILNYHFGKLNKTIILTASETLAGRDFTLAQDLIKRYNTLTGSNIVVSYLNGSLDISQRLPLYDADIIYAEHSVLCFDYLRYLCGDIEQPIRYPSCNLIADEADELCIDSAVVPLILSDARPLLNIANDQQQYYNHQLKTINNFISKLEKNIDYTDSITEGLNFSLKGIIKVEQHAKVYLNINLEQIENDPTRNMYYCALFANYDLHRNTHYMVDKQTSSIILLDPAQGRILPGRKMTNGMHEAICAKEGIEVALGYETSIYVTYQSFLNEFKSLAGMSGTITTESEELGAIFNGKVINVLKSWEHSRVLHDMKLFATASHKIKATIQLYKLLVSQNPNKPIVIFCSDMNELRQVKETFAGENITHCQLLDATNEDKEMSLIRYMGCPGMLTICTPLIVRGTDIKLGGDILYIMNDPETTLVEKKHIYKKYIIDKRLVHEAGGLTIITLIKGPVVRNDEQIFGRCGRQGSPGEVYRLYSMDDHFFKHIRAVIPTSLIETDDVSGEILNMDLPSICESIASVNQQNAFRQRASAFEFGWVPHRHIVYLRKNLHTEKYFSKELDAAQRIKLLHKIIHDHLLNTQIIKETVAKYADININPMAKYVTILHKKFQDLLKLMPTIKAANIEKLESDL
jgi:preprotein translocase subunit SecA